MSARKAMGLVVAAVAGLVTGCSSQPAFPTDSQAPVQVGDASVAAPNGWVVLAPGQRPRGWDYAVQDHAGTAATVQLAVDGTLGAFGDGGMGLAVLQAAPQVGSLKDWKQIGQVEHLDAPDGQDSSLLRFDYAAESGRGHGGWVVTCSRTGRRSCIAVQVSALRSIERDEIVTLAQHVHYSPQEGS